MNGIPYLRTWRQFGTRTWENYMPMPQPQRTDLLPRPDGDHANVTATHWGGTCIVQAFYETITSRLRMWYEKIVDASEDAEGLWYDPNSFQVDLQSLIHCAAGYGLLTEEGATSMGIGHLAATIGIPLKGEVLPYANRRDELPAHHPAYARGIIFTYHQAVPLPPGIPSPEQFEASMLYREHICSCLDSGPIEVSFQLQKHYWIQRPANQPYRRNLDSEEKNCPGHSITVYGYDCPDGTVRSLKLNYQENALRRHPDAALALLNYPDLHNGPSDRHIIDPDAIDWYTVPCVQTVKVKNTPGVFKRFQY